METLSERLAKQSDPYSSDDQEWVQFIKDHRVEILKKSELVSIDPDTMAMYKYRPEEFLDSLNRSRALSWIMLWINNIRSAHHFVGLSSIAIPDRGHIDNLKRLYRTYIIDFQA